MVTTLRGAVCAYLLQAVLPKRFGTWSSDVEAEGLAVDADAEADEDDSMLPGAALQDALDASRALWTHLAVQDCLQAAGPQPEEPGNILPQRPQLVTRIWELELKHVVLASVKESMLSLVASDLRARLSSEAARHREMQRAERAELVATKDILEKEYGFLYDVKKTACEEDARASLDARMAAQDAELSSPCSGRCSKLSIAGSSRAGECREAAAQGTPCPEGTACACRFESRPKLAAVVFPVAYALSSAALAYLLPKGIGFFVPGPMEVSALVSFLVAGKAAGCRCLPSPCTWVKGRGACAPQAVPGARNAFQAVLPYVGQVCAPSAAAGFSVQSVAARVSGATAAPQCELRPCLAADGVHVGQVGNATFNCPGYMANATWALPPLADRLAEYAELFPETLEAHMVSWGRA
eukprot:TRINITY_DN21305_c0_g1_i1.p1 TRINITY_DN21305_c0_g1~~TRINITY_DN21305_c0_g1_i1.p1  ORF type:complete len:411 (+),score=72.56 TRINITY_DN21305_c0_g1_i1:70-1302(+)